jgi:hypothetical protein
MLILLYLLGGGALFLTWLCLLSVYVTKNNLEIQEKQVALKFRKLAYDRESSITTPNFLKMMFAGVPGKVAMGGSHDDEDDEIPEAIQNLIDGSPDHEEIQEIDSGDTLIGIVFNSSYPPEFSEND